MPRPPPSSTLFPYTTLFRSNQALRESADKANRYANLLMPINANIGWLSYALVAIIGAVDRKSTRLNSSHVSISYAVFCLKKKKKGRSAVHRTHDVEQNQTAA